MLETVKGSRPGRGVLVMVGCLLAGAGVLGSWYLFHLKRWARPVVTIIAVVALGLLTIMLMLPRNVFSPTTDWQENLLLVAMTWMVMTYICLRVPALKRTFN